MKFQIIFLLLIAFMFCGCQLTEHSRGAGKFVEYRITNPIKYLVVKVPRDKVIRPAARRYREAEEVK